YRYTYDAAGNMVTKKEPFFDDFNDGNYTGWNGYEWQVVNGAVKPNVDGFAHVLYVYTTDANHETSFDYTVHDTSSSEYNVNTEVRVDSGGRPLAVAFYGNRAE